MKKKKPNVVFIICLIVLIAAVAILVVYQVQKQKKEQSYADLAEQVTVETEEVSEEEPEEEPEELQIPIDFTALQEQNPDAYAWIHIEDTQVDYPILQSAEGEDEDYYLDHTFEREEGLPGSIYTQYTYNTATFDDPVTVVYGHNMRDDSFFGGLSEYLDEDYRNSHSEILVYTPEHIYHYNVVFTVTYDDRHILATYDCSNTDRYADFLTSIQTERVLPSWISDPFEVTTDDHLLILSTCNSNSDERFLVGAKLVQTE